MMMTFFFLPFLVVVPLLSLFLEILLFTTKKPCSSSSFFKNKNHGCRRDEGNKNMRGMRAMAVLFASFCFCVNNYFTII
jgi:hypothetical protein